MAEGRKVKLTITSAHGFASKETERVSLSGERDEAETENIQTQVTAQYYRRGDTHYLLYEERLDGYEETFHTRLKFRQDYLELCRQGKMGSRMVFETLKTHRTEYPTPYGTLFLEVVTDLVRIEENEKTAAQECPCVAVEYCLKNGEQLIGSYRLRLEAQSL